MSKELKSWLTLGVIVVLLVAGTAGSWVVNGSIPPNCHKKLDPGFCVTRNEKSFNQPGRRTQLPPIGVPLLVSVTPRW